MTSQEYKNKLYNKLMYVEGFVDVEVVGNDVIVYVTNDIDTMEVWDLVGAVTFKRVKNEAEEV